MYDLSNYGNKPRSKRKIRKTSKDSSKIRIIFSLIMFSLLVFLYAFRAVEIAVFSEKLREKAKEQSTAVITIRGKRGEILARNGEVIAKDIPSYSVWINPRAISKNKNKVRAIYKIARKLGIRNVKNKLKKKLYFTWLKRKLDEDQLNTVMKIAREYGLKSYEIGYIKEWKRFYPYEEILAPVLGFTNIDSQGLAGIELYYDKFLKGDEKKVTFLRDALGKIIMRSAPSEPRSGNSIKTTIDLELQINLYKELKNQLEKVRAKSAFAVAMDPKTGEILAAVSLPSINPSRPSIFKSRFYQVVYEPGSVFKVFTIAIALETGAISEKDTFFCYNGRWTFKNITIEDVEKIGYATLNEVFAKSSNICTAQISLLIGKEKFYNYLVRLGFGQKTGVDLPGEEKGILHHFSKWYDVDHAIIGFGYFIGVNALQVIRAFSVFANGGYLVKPYIVKEIISPYGEIIKENKPEFSDRVFSPETINKMRELLREVVAHGTGIAAEVPVFLSAGKTGTARKMKNGRYVEEYYSSFIGFSPFEDPKIALFVVFDEPEKKYYGGEVAAPVFAKVTESYLSSRYSWVENITEQQEAEQTSQHIPPIQHKLTLSEFLESLPEDKLKKEIEIKGYGFVSEVRESEEKITVFLSP